ncbi:hypothetical protein LCGC14_1529200 [marine sediment metagenome]|uniref:Uncharacterized protein n=1 Tax=marine sediment metagenome TaxID=412755 RepID=A0A0F9JH50_9ZZZZ
MKRIKILSILLALVLIPSIALGFGPFGASSKKFKMSDDGKIGLLPSGCYLEFDDQTIDEANFINCNVGFETSTPAGLIHAVLAAGRPVIFGGDVLATVTGVTGTDANPTVLTVATTNGVAEGDAVIINSGTNATVGTYWVASVVVDTTVTLDRNASSGAISAASITYINDPLIIESGSGSGEPRIVLPVQNDAVTPTWAFGSGKSGMYAPNNNTLITVINGTAIWQTTSGRLVDAIMGTGPALLNEVASASNPTIISQRNDVNTGMGYSGGDALSLIAGGVEAQRLTEASRTIETDATVCQDNSGVELKTVAAHGLAVDDVVQVAAGGGTLCGNLSPSTNYYVLAVGSTTTATLSASRGGSIVAYSSVGVAFTSYNMEITINTYGDVDLNGSKLNATVMTLTTAQVNALRATPIIIVPAQGANTIIKLVSAMITYDYASAAFTVGADEDFVIEYADGTDTTASIESTAFLDQADDEVRYYPNSLAAGADLEASINQGLQIFNTGTGETADGGGEVDIRITYRVYATGF